MNRRELGKGLVAASLAATTSSQRQLLAESMEQGKKQGGWSVVAPGIWKCVLGKPEAVTPVSSRLVAPDAQGLAKLGSRGDAPIPPPLHRTGQRGTVVSFPISANEQIYGFGLQLFSLESRGKKRLIKVNADPRADTGESHAPVPFFVSSKGYGVFVDTARYATFYCGSARPKPAAGTGGVPGQTEPLSDSGVGVEELSEMIVEIPTAPGVAVYVFSGPTMLDVVKRYNLFSGGGVLPPAWGLGFWYRASSSSTDDYVVALAKEFRDRKIPCDVLGLEPGWQTHAYSCTFAWNKSRFKDPQAFATVLTKSGYHLNLWEHAFTNPASPLFASLRPVSGDKGVWGGLVPDFQDPKARTLFGDYHGKEFIERGISGFKLDECDNSDYTGGWSFPELSQFPSGVDGEQMHNLFGLRYQKAIWDQFVQRKVETYSLVRSSGALATPYPFVLYSDLYDHRQFVRGLVTSSFSGLLWCPEVRDAKSEEDLIRRLQTVMFSPLAMVNGWYIPNPPWKQLDRKKNNANELTPHWEGLEARCREIIGWRMQLIPYLLSAFVQYAEDGTPPFRALALDYPEMKEVGKIDDAWMVGDRMLVAPLFAGEPGRKLTLPPGQWHDFWTGKTVDGGAVLELKADHKNIPVFVKAGSVVPLAEITNSTADQASLNLNVMVFGDGRLPISLRTREGAMRLSWRGREGGSAQEGAAHYVVKGWKQMGQV